MAEWRSLITMDVKSTSDVPAFFYFFFLPPYTPAQLDRWMLHFRVGGRDPCHPTMQDAARVLADPCSARQPLLTEKTTYTKDIWKSFIIVFLVVSHYFQNRDIGRSQESAVLYKDVFTPGSNDTVKPPQPGVHSGLMIGMYSQNLLFFQRYH